MATMISVQVSDSEGNSMRVPYYFEDTVATVADAQTKFNAIATALDAVTHGKILGAEVSFKLTLPSGLDAAAEAGSRVDAGATLSFANSAGRAWSHYIPAVDPDGIVNKTVVTAFFTAYSAALVGSTAATDENGLDLVSFRGGKQSVRRG